MWGRDLDVRTPVNLTHYDVHRLGLDCAPLPSDAIELHVSYGPPPFPVLVVPSSNQAHSAYGERG